MGLLSDVYGLNTEIATMRNLSDFVDDFNDLTSYTPIVAINAGTATLNTVTFAQYLKIGTLVYVRTSVDVTLGGSPGAFLTVTLPFTAMAGAYAMINASYGQSTTIYRASGILTDTRVNILKEASAAHTTGTWQLHFSGFYIST